MIRPLLALAAAACVALAVARRSADPALAITGVTVVDSAGARRGVTVVVEDGRIVAVGERARVPRGARVVDGAGKFLIPGLWDMHAHPQMWGPAALDLELAHGITGVRSMGAERFAQARAWRDSIEAGTRPGPRMRISSPVVESPQWLASVRELARRENMGEKWLLPERFGPSTPEEARAWVDSVAALGADFIKIRNYPAPAVMRALFARARERGLPVAGHVSRGMAPAELVEMGMASFEHGFVPPLPASAASRDSLFRRMAARGTAIVPTLVTWDGRAGRTAELRARLERMDDPRLAYVPAHVLGSWRDELRVRDRYEGPQDWSGARHADVLSLREMIPLGVVVMAGSDEGAPFVVAGFALHDEMALLVDSAGMTPLEALRAATSAPARFLGLSASTGTVAPGKSADLVLLDADPLADIHNTRRIRAVVRAGRLLDRAALDRLLAAAHP